MIIEISVAVAVLIFAILTFFVVRTLITLQSSLKRIDRLMLEVDLKIRHLESTMRTISNLGDIAEQQTEQLKQQLANRVDDVEKSSECSGDLATWLIASVNLGGKLLARRFK